MIVVTEELEAGAVALDVEKIHRGECLAPGETLLWEGRPAVYDFTVRAFHLWHIAGYALLLQLANAWQAWRQELPLDAAMRLSLPLLLASLVAFGIFAGLAYAAARSTRYRVTERRVILHYGIAMPATLSLPFREIAAIAVSPRRDGNGDIALKLRSGNRIAYLKLWPHARPWHLKAAEPMLRSVPNAETVGMIAAEAMKKALISRP